MSKYLYKEYVRKFYEDSNIRLTKSNIYNWQFNNSIDDKIFRSLMEKTYNIDKDVDYIYNNGFKKTIDDFLKNNNLPSMRTYKKIKSNELKSKDCKESNLSNPITILCGGFSNSYYDYKNSNIYISLNMGAFKHLNNKNLSINDMRAIKNEISENRIKATIYHELSHWISDSINNSYLSNLFKRVNSTKDDFEATFIRNMGLRDVNMTYYEIDAQIRGIKQIKRTHKKEWDKMTLVDLFYKYSTLRQIGRTLYGFNKNVYNYWMKDLIKRMNREGLLGNNMRDYPTFDMIESRSLGITYHGFEG